MNAQLLIDNIVRQTTVLVAQLATSRGLRAPLAHLANQVFLDLASEVERQGLSRKVSADMFGLALRSYRRRIQRLNESSTDRGRSLWEAVLDYLGQSEVVMRADVLRRFHRDDEAVVRGILSDLCESGLVFRLGRGDSTAFRAATTRELDQVGQRGLGLDELLWVVVYREGPLDVDALSKLMHANRPALEAALARLLEEKRIEQEPGSGKYRSAQLVLMLNDEAGWEASMFDHYQALVRTLCVRLRGEGAADTSGGSTYTFDVWDGHPLGPEVRDTLRRLRRELGDLWDRVERHNGSAGVPAQFEQITVYAGQSGLMRDKFEHQEE